MDIVIVHGPSDDEVLPYVITQIRKNVKNFRDIYIITHDSSIDLFDEIKGCKVIDEKIFPFKISDVNEYINKPKRNGWYLQQLLKLYASLVLKDMLDDYVVVDADTLFLREIEFKSGDKYLFNMSDEYWVPYFEHMKRMHPSFEKVVKFSGISHHMIFNRHIVSEMMSLVERHHNLPFWIVFLKEVSPEKRDHSGASEYEMYFNYMLKNHKNKLIPRKLRFENTSLSVDDVLKSMTNTDIYYASLHGWMVNRQPRFKSIRKIISGENLQLLCDVTVITKEIEKFHTSLSPSVKKVYMECPDYSMIQGKVFVYTHILDEFIEKIWPNMNDKYILMTHNSDHGIHSQHLSLLNDDKLIHMFSQNTWIEHPKLTALPIGIANSMWPHGQPSSIEHLINIKNNVSKKERIYVNVNESTNRKHRSKVLEVMRNNSLSDFYPQNRPHRDYLSEMAGYKWILSPKENGVDCHRLWEVLYSGGIAICDDSVNARAFKNMGLPIILVDDYSKITLEWLNGQVVSFDGVKDVLSLDWWKNKINSYLPKEEGSFVLVYLGTLRDYIYECVKQIRLWNPKSTAYLCVNNKEENKRYLDLIKEFNVIVVYIEDLERTEHHKNFDRDYTNTSMNGFWKYTMERFFVVEECMRKYNLENIFHLEIDNLIYFRVEEILENCKIINKILIPSDSERRYIAGTCFINNPSSLSILNKFFKEHGINKDEMHTLFAFTKCHDEVDTWPVLPYGDNMRLIYENRKHLINDINRISKSGFLGVFDAAAIGQFFFGIDKYVHNPNNTDGFVNKDSIFDVSRLWFKWVKEEEKIQRLYMSLNKEEWYPVYNIHVHNKDLTRGLSDIQQMTKHLPNIL